MTGIHNNINNLFLDYFPKAHNNRSVADFLETARLAVLKHNQEPVSRFIISRDFFSKNLFHA